MKSIQIREYGGNDVVEVKKTASVPNISSGKVLVNVKASGVNPVDWKIRGRIHATTFTASIPIDPRYGLFRRC
jgi:NADPH:quinone reductase-like Zn-dependent oxidoreductase